MNRPRTRRYLDALAGIIPAEQLPTSEREYLVGELVQRGWSVAEIALHTSETEYTTARIRARIKRAQQVPAA